MGYKVRIETNPDIMLGKPVIKGTRITVVEPLLSKLGDGADVKDILSAYPNLKRVDVMVVASLGV